MRDSTTLLDAIRADYLAGNIEADEFEAEVAAVLESEDRDWYPLRVFKTWWGEWSWSACTGEGLATGYAPTEYRAWKYAREAMP